MEKTKLSLDELQVQSFATTEAAAEQRGTVRGHADTDAVACPTVDPNDTCWASCEGTCESACDCQTQGFECENQTLYGQSYLATCCQSMYNRCD